VFADDELWDEYGVDSDIIVRSHSTSTVSSMLNNDVLQPFTHDFPHADIHELISSDILHQLIKGTFKDHLVTWVEEYLYLVHSKKKADDIMDEIDRRYTISVSFIEITNSSTRIAATPAFPELRRFKQGRRFKQWTGDDSKALMKVCTDFRFVVLIGA